MRRLFATRWLATSAAACLLAAVVAGPAASAATVGGPIGCTALVSGDTGTPVRVLQGDLAQFGLYTGNIDGIFGPETAATLRTFQSRHGMAATGVLNPTTLEAITVAMGLGTVRLECGGGATRTVSGPIGCHALGLGDQGLPVRVLQGDLVQLDAYHGAISGVFGVSTETALADLQRAHGLPATGVLNGATLNAIGTAMGLGNVTPSCGGAPSQSAMESSGGASVGAATQTFAQGTRNPQISGGLRVGGTIDGLPIVRVIHLTATAYGATAQDNYPYGPTDAFGLPLKPGDVAVDPTVIPLNTKMYVAGYQTPYLPAGGELAIARDTGGAIKGARIDIYINSTNESLINSFGIQSVMAYILG